ncbi:hypothetical protein TSO221_26905, partial [Azospirillum sp. TSO22-1]
ESFFGSLKAELVHEQHYPTRDAAKRDLLACIEGYYNRQPLHSALGDIPQSRPSCRPRNPVSILPREAHLPFPQRPATLPSPDILWRRIPWRNRCSA